MLICCCQGLHVDTTSSFRFERVLLAKYLRIEMREPTTGSACLQIELHGCPTDGESSGWR